MLGLVQNKEQALREVKDLSRIVPRSPSELHLVGKADPISASFSSKVWGPSKNLGRRLGHDRLGGAIFGKLHRLEGNSSTPQLEKADAGEENKIENKKVIQITGYNTIKPLSEILDYTNTSTRG